MIDAKVPLILKSPSGTGKTCAYCVSMLEVICRKYFLKQWERPPSISKGCILGLVLAHSPELCQQISREMQSISRHLPLSIFTIISSISLQDDWEEVAEANIVIATPGIIAKLLVKKKIRTFCLTSIVIDEWDKMLSDKGLSHDVEQIVTRPLPEIQQYICASATYSQVSYKRLVELIPLKWNIISCDWNSKSRPIHHFLYRAGSFDKRVNTIITLFRHVEFHQALIFCNLHQLSEATSLALNEIGFPCAYISSQLEQKERIDRISEFRDLLLRCLVTTDITSRGIDISNVNIVISLDLPYDNETFLHRVGRTGRFMTDGMSLTFYKRQESKRVQEIKESFGIMFQKLDLNNEIILKLPIMQNEIQVLNFRKLKEIENNFAEIEKQKLDKEEERKKVPMMFYCDKENEYWYNYRDICNEFKPPFVP
ncbi:putative ATP-dependent RNA helicase DDX20 [Histomonas meleagridis]|uniref:putative ATP-dependent RNA helicase DDX20 n=1 Tax=Histomonas meleagridis TaxID=135588 RepID=UPI003559D36F|nr:putative ATP-dependent RNA helicase DDX20 [Histomonas meleagridis]KAH0805081.1 putative ATP-dependent RNA helicase DDX20 [Histomonas meleagridis]